MQKFALLFVTLSALTACSSWTTRRTPNQEMKVVLKDAAGNTKEAPAAATVRDGKEVTKIPVSGDAHAEAQEQAAEMKEAVAAAAQHVQDTHGKNKREAGPVPAEKAFGWLKNGNTRFVKGFFRKDGAHSSDRIRLVAGQKPHAVILSCSDSRVPPEVVFDQKLGEVFVVRTAGESLDNNVVGSIEYAVQHLGANLVVVMGHESCGAVRATLQALQGADMGSPAMNGLVNDLKPHLQQFASQKPSTGVLDESWANVEGVTRDLMERSAILRDAIASGEVKVTKAMYHLDSGRVEWRP
ncbi:carbonic anhydrase [Bdellovibrio sp. HCB2-146]|uniref:carbonic anhydrase n=1 Tax=Bdellovibrio sp. HCB2-146 TaxID=3394362 RepID=UPI0039BC561D